MNSSYSCALIVLKFCCHFLHRLKIYLWFYTSFWFFLTIVAVWISQYLIWNSMFIYRQWVLYTTSLTDLNNLKVLRYILHGMKMCMCILFSVLICFSHIFTCVKLDIFAWTFNRLFFSSAEPMAQDQLVLSLAVHRRPHIWTTSPLKPLGQFSSNFMWNLLLKGYWKFVQMVTVH